MIISLVQQTQLAGVVVDLNMETSKHNLTVVPSFGGKAALGLL